MKKDETIVSGDMEGEEEEKAEEKPATERESLPPFEEVPNIKAVVRIRIPFKP